MRLPVASDELTNSLQTSEKPREATRRALARPMGRQAIATWLGLVVTLVLGLFGCVAYWLFSLLAAALAPELSPNAMPRPPVNKASPAAKNDAAAGSLSFR
jgi:hypothetical protein